MNARLISTRFAVHLAVAAVILGLATGSAVGQPSNSSSTPRPLPPERSAGVGNRPPGTSEEAHAPDPGYLTRHELLLSTEVLVFGFVVLAVEFVLLLKRRTTQSGITRAISLTLILVGTLFALTAGFGGSQIAPAMGLFGTVAGYLLSRSPSSRQPEGGGR